MYQAQLYKTTTDAQICELHSHTLYQFYQKARLKTNLHTNFPKHHFNTTIKMLFTLTITALLSTLAAAAPNPQTSTPTPNEIASVTDFLVRRHGSTVDVVDFKLTGRNATDLACTASGPKLSTIYNCGESKYRFSLSNGTETDYGLVVYHEVAFA